MTRFRFPLVVMLKLAGLVAKQQSSLNPRAQSTGMSNHHSTLDFESSDPSSNLSGTLPHIQFFYKHILNFPGIHQLPVPICCQFIVG